VQARLRTNPERYFRAYLCSGVTGVFDVGGYPWTWSLPGRGESDLLAPRIGAAGPLLSTVDHWLNLPGELQLIHMADEESVRATVRYHATRGTEAIKVWYVMPRMAALVRAAAEETREAGLRLIVHATGLWEAKDAVRAGADLLVHSVFEEPVDDEFLALARESGVIYTPTITVIEGYGDVYLRSLDDSRYPLDCVDPLTRSFATPNAIASDRLPPFASDAAVAERQQRRLDFAMSNAKAVFDAGISVAMGTDAGNPGGAVSASRLQPDGRTGGLYACLRAGARQGSGPGHARSRQEGRPHRALRRSDRRCAQRHRARMGNEGWSASRARGAATARDGRRSVGRPALIESRL
jgi:hypothetical protein